MSQTLYRKYRPKTFDDIIGQTHIVQTLENAITRDLVGHAYLFTGPRGTGKTSVARIFAAEINCMKRAGFTPASKDVCARLRAGTALDLIEIDAASHTGVDNIRDLKETIVLPPSEAPFKIYIIDEVHMLSTGAFNALLKTLEEPPAHAIFILATTEVHKVPETILSRVQRFDFTRLPLAHIVEKLGRIAKSEKITVDDDALEMIAIAAEGGMRDAESLLAQVIALEDKKITSVEVARTLGTAENEKIFTFLESLCHKNTEICLATIAELAVHGYDLRTFAKSLITHLRSTLFLSINEELSDTLNLSLTKEQQKKLLALAQSTNTSFLVRAIEEFASAQSAIGTSVIAELPLEIAVVKLCDDDNKDNSSSSHNSSSGSGDSQQKTEDATPHRPMRKIAAETSTKASATDAVEPTETVKTAETIKPTEAPETAIESAKEHSLSDICLKDVVHKWKECISTVKQSNAALAGLLMNTELRDVTDDTLTIAVRYRFHKDKVMDGENKLTIQNALATICGVHLNVDAVVDASIAPPKDNKPSSLLSSAAALMGGTVVQES